MSNRSVKYQEAMRRGQAFLTNQQWKEAFQLFRLAVTEAPTEAAAYAGLAEACFGLKMLDRALESYKLATRYSGGNLTYLKRVADIQERLGQLNEASRTYMAAGELLFRQGDMDEAIDHWELAVRLDPNLIGAHQRLAMMAQRQNNTRLAVREYLALARILQMQGEQQKALQMCRAAQRLDPQNPDVLMAIQLVQFGENALPDEAEEAEVEEEVVAAEPEPEPAETLADTVRQIATIFEQERQVRQPVQVAPPPANPIEVARRLAQEKLAEEIFRDEEDDEALYGKGRTGLSKLERDALIGQGMDFQTRGYTDEAIRCYERAINGGLQLSAAHFTLGLLYLDRQRVADAKRVLGVAYRDVTYRPAIQEIAKKI